MKGDGWMEEGMADCVGRGAVFLCATSLVVSEKLSDRRGMVEQKFMQAYVFTYLFNVCMYI
jgi:hypothetical protein